MDVYTFCELCNDDSLFASIFDCRTEERVFRGTIRDLMYSGYEDYDVLSIDILSNDMGADVAVEINIETEEGDDE